MRYGNVLVGISVSLLMSCTSLIATSPPPVVKATKPAVAPAPPERAPPPARATEASYIDRMLSGAEAALAADRLTTPAHDNAFDRYQAVLMLRPEHPQAVSGLQQILLRYLALAREAAAHNHFQQARTLLDRARRVDKDNALIRELDRQIAQAETAQMALQPSVVKNEYPLAAARLEKRDSGLVDQLQKIAREVRQTGETLLIVARSDAEGRWIYQQMREAVPGFRLRGDIKLGQQPKIKLLPPIN